MRSARMPGSLARRCAVLVDHVGRAAVDVQVVLDRQRQRLAVEQVGGEDDLGRMRLLAGLEAGGERAVDFARADGVDDDAVAAHQVEDRQVGAGLLGVANRVELLQLADAADDRGGVVDVDGGAEALGERRDRLAGDVGDKRELREGNGHFSRVYSVIQGTGIRDASESTQVPFTMQF